MGVTFSMDENGMVDKSVLRQDQESCQALITAFVRHCFPPVGNKDELFSLFRAGVWC